MKKGRLIGLALIISWLPLPVLAAAALPAPSMFHVLYCSTLGAWFRDAACVIPQIAESPATSAIPEPVASAAATATSEQTVVMPAVKSAELPPAPPAAPVPSSAQSSSSVSPAFAGVSEAELNERLADLEDRIMSSLPSTTVSAAPAFSLPPVSTAYFPQPAVADPIQSAGQALSNSVSSAFSDPTAVFDGTVTGNVTGTFGGYTPQALILAALASSTAIDALPQALSATSSPAFAGLTLGSLSGLLYGTDGAVSAISTSSLGFLPASAIGSGTQGELAFYNGAGNTLTATSSLFITQNGNFGVGTTSPITNFAAIGGGYFGGSLTASGPIYGNGAFSISGLSSFTEDYESPAVTAGEGYTTDGTNHYTFTTGGVYKYDQSWNLLLSNTNIDGKLAAVGGSAPNHIGGGTYYNGSLYLPIQYYAGCGAGQEASAYLVQLDAGTLAMTASTSVEAYEDDVSAMTVAPDQGPDGTIFVSSFCDPNHIFKYDLKTMVFLGTTTLSSSITGIQGIAYKNGLLYVNDNTANNNLDVYVIDMSGNVTGPYPIPTSISGEAEGIDFSQSTLRMEVSSSTYNIYYFTPNYAPSLTVSPSGAVSIPGTLTTGIFSPSNLVVTGKVSSDLNYNGINDGLIFHVPFSEGTGTTAYDAGPYANTVTVQGTPVWTQGISGNAVYLNGSTMWTVPSNASLGGSTGSTLNNFSGMTANIWMLATSSSMSGAETIFSKHTGGTTGTFGINLNSYSQLNAFFQDQAGDRYNLTANTLYPLNDGNWHMLTFACGYSSAYGTSTETLYVDGVSIGTSTCPASIQSQTSPVDIGSYSTVGSQYFVGDADEPSLWSRGLSGTEVAELYSQSAGSSLSLRTNGGLQLSGPVSSELSYNDINDDLQLSLPFSEGSGATTYDRSKTGAAGTLVNGPAWITGGKYGDALYFNGTNQYVSVPDATVFNGLSAITASAWFLSTTSMSSSEVIISKWPAWLIQSTSATSLDFYTQDASTTRYSCIASNLPAMNDGNWHLVTGTYDGTTQRLYLDGVQVCSVTRTGSLENETDVVSAGTYGSGNGAFWNGDLDEFNVWSRALSAGEVRTLYTQGLETSSPYVAVNGYVGIGTTTTGSTLTVAGSSTVTGQAVVGGALGSQDKYSGIDAGLEFYESFDEGSGSTTYSRASNGNNGTLAGNITWTKGIAGYGISTVNGGVVSVLPGGLASTSAITASIWFNTTTTPSSSALLTSFAGGTTGSFDLSLPNATEAELATVNASASRQNIVFNLPRSITDGKWHNLVATYDGVGVTSMYLDGSLVGTSSAQTGPLQPSTTDICVGGYYGNTTCANTGFNFTGTLDEAKIWNRALSSSEVAYVYDEYTLPTFFTTNVSTGNVGIGTTSPSATFSIEGNSAFPTNNLFMIASSSGKSLLTLLSNGNLGIATSTPATALDVAGDITDENVKACDSSNNALGTNAQGQIVCDASLSDERLKSDITSLDGPDSLSLIDSLNPVSFYWKDPSIPGTGSANQQFGFIAQQVNQVAPNLVGTTTPTYLTPDVTYDLNYQGLIAPLVAAVQEQELQIGSATSTIASSTAETSVTLTSLYSQVGALTAALSASTTNLANAISSLASSAASTTSGLRAQIGALASSTASSLASVASTTSAALSASPGFVQTIANEVVNTLDSAGGWVVNQISALNASFTYVSAANANVTTLTAQTLCVGTTCINEDQLKALLANINAAPAPVPTPPPADAGYGAASTSMSSATTSASNSMASTTISSSTDATVAAETSPDSLQATTSTTTASSLIVASSSPATPAIIAQLPGSTTPAVNDPMPSPNPAMAGASSTPPATPDNAAPVVAPSSASTSTPPTND